jgi:chemotaxis protein MotA
VADALPGFGIVAAVLGIVITMASIGGPPEELGQHVAAALVGTFLGILLAYGFVGPMATFLEHVGREEAQFFVCLKTALLASLQGYAPQVAIEFGRKAIFTSERPSSQELMNRIKKK